jgi:hypothetical protein
MVDLYDILGMLRARPSRQVVLRASPLSLRVQEKLYRWIYIFTWLTTDNGLSPEQVVELVLEVANSVFV